MPETPQLVLAVECPHCSRLSRIAWYHSLQVLPPRCQGCGRVWTAAETNGLTGLWCMNPLAGLDTH